MDKTCYYRIDEEKATESYVTDKCSTPDVVSGVMQLQLPGFDKKDSTESFVTDKCSTPDVVSGVMQLPANYRRQFPTAWHLCYFILALGRVIEI
ncbi:hypothetical protein PF001_g5972 [Phytophthora fragariae]|uniref:Uncharacterized protein n=1 Tax=Phytophthora fragariae TaxID=53985 RepID=A0A6A4E7B5_9STRA|nr:hypothetical protein PF004_g1405 [Phytophthora fragariae]KAE9319265.1 hypothetical protein PF001_g5972 [Phytophthora fragariae]KAE9354184.1 hypothetical protein PF008_g4652 [Phytophthora fragariae]